MARRKMPGWLRTLGRNLLGNVVNTDTRRRAERLVRPGDRVLDLGCRAAPYTRQLPNEVIGLDLAFPPETAHHIRARKPDFQLLIGRAQQIPLRSASVDLVIFTEVIEHFYEGEAAIAEIARVLKEEGRLLLTTPNAEEYTLEDVKPVGKHVRHYSAAELGKLLTAHFEEVSLEQRFACHPFLDFVYGTLARAHLPLPGLIMALGRLAYNLFFLLERAHLWRGNCNLVAVCARPRQKASKGARHLGSARPLIEVSGWIRPAR